jgi:mannose-1-phosphate guanylyltransferase / phosphomannomutase
MKAVVMAGGEGSRLRPLTIARPKPMVPIVGRPVAEHILNLLKDHGITDVVMTVQYLASNIEDYFGDGAQYGMHIRYSREETPLGTAGSVKNAEEWLNDEPFLVISGDALTDFNLSEIIAFHTEHQAMATLTLAHVQNPLEFGVIITDDEGHITQFLEKPGWGQVFSDTINTGIYVLDPKIFHYFERDVVFDFSNDLFPILLKNGDPLYGFTASGYWCDVGNLGEYSRANADALEGLVQVKIPGHNIGDDVWVEAGAEIAEGAHLDGPIYLGQSARVLAEARIHGPSVIGSYTVVDSQAKIDRSVVWNNSYIGAGAELQGAIVGSHTSIKSKAVLFEGSVVGDDSLIDEGAIIQPGVKIWPKKEIENGAVVSSSIIWGNQGRRNLFGRFGVTGLVNIDITPDMAARLGTAFGAVLKIGGRVCVNRDAHRTARMIKRAVISGLPSAGMNVHDLNTVPLPVARFYVRSTDAVGGVHIRLAPNDPRIVDIKFLDANGLDISKATERKIENLYFREDFRRVYLDEIGDIVYAPGVVERYTDAYLKAVDLKTVRNRRYVLAVDYGHGSGVSIMAPIFNQLDCEVLAINSTMDESRYSRPLDEMMRDRERMAGITRTLAANLGVILDTSCEKLYVVDEQGRLLDNNTLLAVMTDLVLRANPGSTVVVPVAATMAVEKVAERARGQVRRISVSQQVLASASTRENVVLVGDALGGFIFPALHPAFDALFATTKLLEFLARFDVKLADLVDELPPFSQMRRIVDCPWDQKGKVMRLLSEQYRDSHAADGVMIRPTKDEWVLVLPDADRPIFTVFAEAPTADKAATLLDHYVHIVTGLLQE